MPLDHDPRFVSMTRLGAEFGWSVRETARVLANCGYRVAGHPTPKAQPWVRSHPNPVGEPSYQWDLEGMVEQLCARGYEVDDPVRVLSGLLWAACEKFNTHQHKYFEGPKRQRVAREALDARLAPLLDRVHDLPPRQVAEVFANLEQRFSSSEDHWPVRAQQEAWQWMKVFASDRQAYALLLATPDPESSKGRPRM